MLLLHANQPVGRQQLINAVWGTAAPAYVVNLVQKHVSGLRRALEPDRTRRSPSRILSWTDSGYLLTVPADQLDLAQYEREVERSRAARAAGDLSGAAEALRTALRRWRGPLCAGLSSPFLDTARSSYAERRLDAIEELIDLDLSCGAQVDLAELRRLVAEHPLRERLRGLLMLALDRTGRRADALVAFQDARHYLRDELGVAPGPELQRLHRQLLAAEPPATEPDPAAELRETEPEPVVPRSGPGSRNGPAARNEPAASPSLPPPSQLPRALLDFVGRKAELDRLDTLLAAVDQAVAVAVITGMAGVGKTALAVHWAHRVSHHFPDGQLYVNLRGFDPTGPAVEPAEAIRGFLDALAVPPQLIPVNLAAQAALYRSMLAGRRMLVVLDNARSADQVRPLLPGSPGCLVVVTSRDSLIGLVAEGARAVPVDLLDYAESELLLTNRLGPDRAAAEPEAVGELAAACAGLPLALSIVTARGATQSHYRLAALAAQIGRVPAELDAFDSADPATSLRTVFSWSYRTLTPSTARMFRLLGLHSGSDVTTAAAASVAGVSEREAAGALAELTRAHLATERVPGRFTRHDLIRSYATEQVARVDTEADQRAAQRRLLEHYLHSALLADRLLNPHRHGLTVASAGPGVTVEPLTRHDQAREWFTVEHGLLCATVTFASDAGFDTLAWQLGWALNTYLDRAGLWHDAEAVQRVALASAIRAGDRQGQAEAHRNLARAYVRLARADEAHDHLVRSLALFREMGDHTGQGRAHLNLARVAEERGYSRRALRHALLAIEEFRAAGDQVGQADALNAVGWYEAQNGQLRSALARCRQALALNRATGDREGEAHTLDSLGYVSHQLGRLTQAVAYYRRAVRLWQELGDRYAEADTLARIGDTYEQAGDLEASRARWRDALAVLDAFGHPDANRLHDKLNSLSSQRAG